MHTADSKQCPVCDAGVLIISEIKLEYHCGLILEKKMNGYHDWKVKKPCNNAMIAAIRLKEMKGVEVPFGLKTAISNFTYGFK